MWLLATMLERIALELNSNNFFSFSWIVLPVLFQEIASEEEIYLLLTHFMMEEKIPNAISELPKYLKQDIFVSDNSSPILMPTI